MSILTIFLHVENNAPSQETSALHRLAEPPQPLPPLLMNKLCTHEHMCTLCGECVCRYEHWCQKHLYSVHTYTCAGVQNTCLVHWHTGPHSQLKMQIYCTSTPLRRCSNFPAWNPLRTILEVWLRWARKILFVVLRHTKNIESNYDT